MIVAKRQAQCCLLLIAQLFSPISKAQSQFDIQDAASLYSQAEQAVAADANDQTMIYLEQLLFAEPDHMQALVMYADLLASKGDVAAAIRQYKEVLVRQPNAPYVMLQLSLQYIKHGQTGKAQRYLKKLRGKKFAQNIRRLVQGLNAVLAGQWGVAQQNLQAGLIETTPTSLVTIIEQLILKITQLQQQAAENMLLPDSQGAESLNLYKKLLLEY